MKRVGSLKSLCIQSSLLLLLLSSLILLAGLVQPVFATSMDEAKIAYEAKDFSKARSLLESLSKKGDRKAMYVLGTMIRKGQGGIKDEDQALMWLFKSAERNFDPAMMLLGKIMIEQPEAQKDWRQGCMWFRRAAERGNKEGMFYTGTCYRTGQGAPETPKEHVQSLAWFIASEKKGYAGATQFRKDLEKAVTTEQMSMAREKSKTLGKIKKPRHSAPKKQAPVVTAKPAPTQPAKVNHVIKQSKPTTVFSSGTPPLQAPGAPKMDPDFPLWSSWPHADLALAPMDQVQTKFGLPASAPYGDWVLAQPPNSNTQTFTLYTDKNDKNSLIKYELSFRDNKLRKIQTVTQGKRQITVAFNYKGKVSSVANRLNNVVDGPAYTYGNDGTPKKIVNYKAVNGKHVKHGRFASFKDGLVIFEGFHENGKRTGQSCSYDMQGNLEDLWEYKNDKKNGIEAHYKNGRLQNWQINKDGQIQGKVNFANN